MKVLSTSLLILTFLYFIQGLPYGFQSRFMPVYLRTRGVSLTQVGLFKMLLAPWLAKALWAPLVDKYGNKQQWLIGSILGLVLCCAVSSLISPDCFPMLCAVILMLNVCAATQDIAVDSLAVSMLNTEDLPLGNTAQVVGYKLGSIFGGGILVWFLDYLGWQGLFLALAFLYIEALLFVYISPDLKNMNTDNKSSQSSGNNAIDNLHKTDSNCVASNTCRSADDQGQSCQTAAKKPCKQLSMQSEKTADVDIYNDHNDSDHDDIPELSSEESNDGSTCVESEIEEDVCSDSELEVEATPSSGLRRRKKSEGTSPENCIPQCPYEKQMLLDSTVKVPAIFQSLPVLRDVIDVPGTTWMIIYILIYKLGEQGALGMLPLFLVDQDVKRKDMTFWNGLVGQAVSILGSLVGGWILTRFSVPSHLVLQQLGLCRLIPQGAMLWVVAIWQLQLAPTSGLFYIAIVSMVMLMFLSGMVTTVTFTFMMQCSQQAPSSVQATHYTVLATLEVAGKLSFMCVAGYLVDVFGYEAMFLFFVALTVMVLPWLKKCPPCLLTRKTKLS